MDTTLLNFFVEHFMEILKIFHQSQIPVIINVIQKSIYKFYYYEYFPFVVNQKMNVWAQMFLAMKILNWMMELESCSLDDCANKNIIIYIAKTKILSRKLKRMCKFSKIEKFWQIGAWNEIELEIERHKNK